MLLKHDDRHLLLQSTGPMVPDGSIPIVEFVLYLLDGSDKGIPLGRVNDGSHIEGFLKYLDLLDIQIEEVNCAQIVEVFDLMQPRKTTLESFQALKFRGSDDLVEGENRKRDSEMRLHHTGETVIFIKTGQGERAVPYRNVIRPPLFSVEGGVRRITFWMADLVTGDLERWEIAVDADGKGKVEGEVVERDLVFSISPTVEDE